jgi:hypothetical protein
MPIIREIEDKDLIVTILNGRVSHHNLMESFDELADITPKSPVLYELAMNTEDMRLEGSDKMA